MLCLSVSLVFKKRASLCCCRPIEIPILSAALLFLSIGRTRARSDDEKKIKRAHIIFCPLRCGVVVVLFARVVVVH